MGGWAAAFKLTDNVITVALGEATSCSSPWRVRGKLSHPLQDEGAVAPEHLGGDSRSESHLASCLLQMFSFRLRASRRRNISTEACDMTC